MASTENPANEVSSTNNVSNKIKEEASDKDYEEYLKKYGDKQVIENYENKKQEEKLDKSTDSKPVDVTPPMPLSKQMPPPELVTENIKNSNKEVAEGAEGESNHLLNMSEEDITQSILARAKQMPFGNFITANPKVIKFIIRIMQDKKVMKEFTALTKNQEKIVLYRNVAIGIAVTFFLLTLIVGGANDGIVVRFIKKSFLSLMLFTSQFAVFAFFYPTIFKSVLKIFIKTFWA